MTASIDTRTILVQQYLAKLFKDSQPKAATIFGDWLRTEDQKDWLERYQKIAYFGYAAEKPMDGPFTFQDDALLTEKQFTPTPYGLAFRIQYELMKFARFGAYKGLVPKMMKALAATKNTTAYAIFNNAFVTTDSRFTTHAGEALAATTHTRVSGTNGKNHPSTASPFGYLPLQEAWTDYALLENEKGLPANYMPNTVTVHASEEWQARVVLETPTRPGDATDDVNTMVGSLKINCAGIYQASQTAFFLTTKPSEMSEDSGMCFKNAISAESRSHFDPQTWATIFQVYSAWGVRVYDWLGFWASPGA